MNEDFQNWFDSNVSAWSFLSEYFYGDCEIEDKEKRKDIMYKWLLAAY